MRYSVEEIEDLLLAKIQELTYLNTVDSYEAKYDVTLEQLIHRSPAVFAALESIEPAEELAALGLPQPWRYTWNLGIVCRDLRGPREGRRGGEGAYQILGDLQVLLEGHRLAQGLEPLEFMGAEFVHSTNIGVVYRATYTLTQAGG